MYIKKIVRIVVLCFISCIAIIGVAFYYTQKNGEIISVSKQELREMIESKKTFFVYIGRPDCPDCQEFFPKFEKRVHDYRIIIYYLNTKVKVSKKQEMKVFVNSMGVSEVPAIIEVDKGEIIKVYNGQNNEDMNKFYTRLEEK